MSILDTNNSRSNSLLGTNNFLVEREIAFRGAASDHSQAKQTSLLQRFELFCKQRFENSDYENTVKITGCDSHDKRNSSFSEVSVTDEPAKVNLFRKPDLRRQYRHFRQPLRMMGRRSRDREPSRISLTKLLRLMKCRKLRKKHKKLFTKSFPVSSVLHNIASNYKQWNIRYIQSLDCFYSSYFTKIKKSTVAVYNKSEKNILLSGDVESNPGPVTSVSTLSQATTNDRSDFLLNYRLLRHGLNQLDVGGGGDCYFNQYHISYMVIHITTWKLDLQVFST